MEPVKLRQIMALLALCAAVTVSFTCILSATQGVFFPFTWTADYTRSHYGITLDAGSHGTRAHIFRWSARVEDPEHPLYSPVTIPQEIEAIDNGFPAISSFMAAPHLIGPNVLKPLVDGCHRKLLEIGLDADEIADTPLFLKATAGMRNMDTDARDGIMGAIRLYLGNKRLSPFRFKADWARTISGEEEGVFGWIAVNTMQGTLLNPALNTIGALDLGGASSQITFSPTSTSVLEDFYELKLGTDIVRLYAHSFIGYGWSDARMRLTTRLALEALFARLQDTPDLLNKSKPVDIAQAVLDGEVRDVKLNPPSRKKDTSLNTEPIRGDVAEIVSYHPCYPLGYSVLFDVPSLLYPDGRFFLDMDVKAVLSYIDALGMDLDHDVVKKAFSPELLAQVKEHPLRTSYLTPVMEEVIRDVRARKSSLQAALAEQAYSPESLSIAGLEAEPFHPFAEPLPPPKVQFRVRFVGSGDFIRCQARARELFYQEPCFLSTCSYNGVYQPRVAESKFLALGQFAKVRQALGISTTATPNTLERRAAEVCAMNITDVRALQKQGEFAPFGKRSVATLCWKAIWAHATLTEGYGLDGDSHAATFFDLESGSTDSDGVLQSPGWALGAMLTEISFFPWQNARGRFEAPFWWALASCLILTILSGCQHAKMKHYRKKLSLIQNRRSDVYHEFSPEAMSPEPLQVREHI